MKAAKEGQVMSKLIPASVLLSCLLPLVSHAVDGVWEINSTCAEQTGCFAGDTAGFPVTISASGSYRLTSNLSVTNADTDAVEVTGFGVTLDLNGFSLVGPVTCDRNSSTGVVTCAPAGSGRGVAGLTRARVVVRDGNVRGFANGGVAIGGRAQVRNVIADSNGGRGIEVGNHSIVSGSTAYRSGDRGIFTGVAALVERSVASENNLDGIWVNGGSSIQRSTAMYNGGYGINLTGICGYRGNTMTFNTSGQVSGGADAGGNICNGSTTCP